MVDSTSLCGANSRYFPIEPHWLFPGMQFLPIKAQAWLAPRWPLGMTNGWPEEQAQDEVMFTELLSSTEMQSYFPDARLFERFGVASIRLHLSLVAKRKPEPVRGAGLSAQHQNSAASCLAVRIRSRTSLRAAFACWVSRP